MKAWRPKTPSSRKTPVRCRSVLRDPVEVYCRLRPLPCSGDVPCVRQVSDTTICVIPPLNSQAYIKGSAKESSYVFKRVFDENASQEEIFNCVALPLVKDVLNGKNGLLFAYGITSSGKTFTMTGSPSDCGILPRSLDVIFSSISHLQTRKYVFKPDGANHFEILETPDALLKEQIETMNPKTSRSRKKDDSDDWSQRIVETTKIDSIEEDYGYAIFVSFVEIYNNYIYDLLEELSNDPGKSKSMSSKNLREDKRQFMYVNGGTEVEVKSAEEAFEILQKGVKRRRIAQTALNVESSRSHSVFTIRVIKAPLDPRGIEVLQNPEYIVVSQLSLVDLAGSERSSRTKGDQDRLREAGNINNSLLTLRTCIETLRENQKLGTTKVVPYRESKMTHLFKHFFDGEGRVRMIICVNPRPEDHDETVHVVKFGELTQEVCVNRPSGNPTLSTRFMPYARGNHHRKLSTESDLVSLMYAIRPTVPTLILGDSQDDNSIQTLIQILKERQRHREMLTDDLLARAGDFRMRLSELEVENGAVQQRNMMLEKEVEQRSDQIKCMDERMSKLINEFETLQRRFQEKELGNARLAMELDQKRQQLKEAEHAKSNMKLQLQEKLVQERQQMKRIMEKRLAEKQAEVELKMCLSDEKFRQLREILNADDWEMLQDVPGTSAVPNLHRNTDVKEPFVQRANVVSPTPREGYNLRSSVSASNVVGKENRIPPPVPPKRLNIPAANPRHSRSHSEGGQLWIEHIPPGSVDTGTILQPIIKKRKSVSKLEVKDITKDAGKYVLVHQEQDSQGDVETQLYKGNIIPSSGGGAQVIFKDVETVQQISPGKQH